MPASYIVSRTTSSSVVTPSRTFCRPLCRSVDHAFLDRELAQVARPARSSTISVAEAFGDLHDLEQADAALVAGAAAAVAAAALASALHVGSFRRVGNPASTSWSAGISMRLLAVLADAAHQALRADQVDGVGHQERLDAHVDEPVDAARRVVGVQRRQHQVARQRRLDAQSPAVSASRISPTRMTFGSWRRNDRSALANVRPMLLAHLHLVDARQVELDRILGRHDVHARLVELRERRIERVGLAAAGRPGDEHHAPRLADRALEPRRARPASKPSCVMSSRRPFGIEQAEHDLLAEERRQHRHAEVDVARRGRGR